MKKLTKILFVLCLLFSFSGCSNAVEEETYDPEKAERQQAEYIACLNEELLNKISSNKKKVKDIPLSDITEKEKDYDFFAAKVSGKERYVVIDSQSEISKEIDKYFLRYSNEYYYSDDYRYRIYSTLKDNGAAAAMSDCNNKIYGKKKGIPYYAEEFSEFSYMTASDKYENKKELFYSDDEYNYYSLIYKSDDILLRFKSNGLKMKIKYALEQKYIIPDQLHFDDIFLSKEKKENTK